MTIGAGIIEAVGLLGAADTAGKFADVFGPVLRGDDVKQFRGMSAADETPVNVEYETPSGVDGDAGVDRANPPPATDGVAPAQPSVSGGFWTGLQQLGSVPTLLFFGGALVLLSLVFMLLQSRTVKSAASVVKTPIDAVKGVVK